MTCMNKTLTAAAAATLLLAALTACGPSAKPKATPVHANSSPTKATTSATPAKGGTAAKKLPTAQAQKKAAAVLEKEDADFRTFLTQGESVVGTPKFTAWYQKAIVGVDMQQNAFKKADAYFTASNEPTALMEQWRSDNGDANTKITQYAQDATSPDAPNAKTRKDAAECLSGLAKADKDAEKIANGG